MSGFFAKLFGRETAAPAEETPERRFWQWFAKRAEKLRAAPLDVFGHADAGFLGLDLSLELTQIEFGLDYVMRDGAAPDGRREMVITADGDPELFPLARRIAEAAPADLPGGWLVSALEDRPDDGTTDDVGPIKINNVKFKPEDLYFVLRPAGPDGRVGIDLYHKRFAEVDPETAQEAADYFLAGALGERDRAARVGKVETRVPPPLGTPEFAGLRVYSELPEAWKAVFPKAAE
jgi:hypothetical protein